MVSDFAIKIASNVLAKAAQLRPASVPNNVDEGVIRSWAECIDMMHRPQIVDLWKEAVTRWAMNGPDDRMFTPYALKCSVTETVAAWESDPGRRDEIETYRYERIRRRVAAGELPPGTETGYEPQSVREARVRTAVPPTGDQRAALHGVKVAGSDD